MTTYTVNEVAAATGIHAGSVWHQTQGKGPWKPFVVQKKPLLFSTLQLPPPAKSKPKVPWNRHQGRTTLGPSKPQTPAPPLPQELLDALDGFLIPVETITLVDGDLPEPPAGVDMECWAIYWASRGFSVQAADYMMGTLIGGPVDRLRKPSRDEATIREMWADWRHEADIAVYPDHHHMFIVEIHRFRRDEPDFIEELEDSALLYSESALGDRRYWLPGRAYSKMHALGKWISIIGIGRHSFLPPSATPAYVK
jgi:hypothetical protein